jgi:hypothetical protein
MRRVWQLNEDVPSYNSAVAFLGRLDMPLQKTEILCFLPLSSAMVTLLRHAMLVMQRVYPRGPLYE